MTTVSFVTATGDTYSVPAVDGVSLMRAAVDNLVPGVVAECGGELSCATCHVVVDPGWSALLPPPSVAELDMLEAAAAEPMPTSRLSCQLACTPQLDGVILHVPDVQ